MNKLIAARMQDHLDVLGKTIEYLEETDVLFEMAEHCVSALSKRNKIFFCGNGGSAADSQHMAAEIVGRFQKDRVPLPAIALTTDTSILTAISNDFGYDEIFERQVLALGQKGDVLFAYSTSGNSKNVIRAVEAARSLGMHTFGFLGRDGGKLKELCDISFVVPDKVTARIQEMHLLAGHILCELMEYDYE